MFPNMPKTPQQQYGVEIKYIPPVVTPDASLYPNNDTSAETIAQMGQALEHPVIIEPGEGLVIPAETLLNREVLLERVATSLQDARDKIEQAKLEGKRIIYVPGSYDLVHKGHAFYVEQVIECVCKEAGCTREELYVVMMADSDSLIRKVKKSKAKVNGGKEPELRPVETAPERLIGMASLNVDLVGILPSDEDDRNLLPMSPRLDIPLMLGELSVDFVKQQMERIADLNLSPEKLATAIEQVEKDRQELKHGLEAYVRLGQQLSGTQPLDSYPVQAWQLFTTSFLNSATRETSGITKRYEPGHTTRIVSFDDTKYLAQVIFLMTYANVAVTIIQDINIGSTSSLLEGVDSWQEIRDFKRAALKEALGETALAKYDEMIEVLRERLSGGESQPVAEV